MRELLRYVLVPALVGAVVGLAVMILVPPEPPPAVPHPGFAAAVQRAAPSVVNIYSSKVVTPPICQLPRFQAWCERFSSGENNHMQSALGSGVVVREDGYILTNNHVIAGADEILVAFNNGQATIARVVGSDPETDLAVIKVEATGLLPIPLGSSNSVRVGDIALAIGNPFGIGQTVSSGIVSAKGRTGISASPYDDFIQTDAAINPGNSGGALIDGAGNLIGINTLIFSRSGGSEGIGFAIPAQLAMAVLSEIVETGRVTRGWLGIELSGTPAQGMGVGLEVTGVLQQGPGDRAGLQVGDLIIAINDQPAVSSAVVSRLIAHTTPGSTIRLDILRGQDPLTVNAQSGERPTPET
jgi:serine protease DegS